MSPDRFQSILCGVEGSEESFEAARQALVLAGKSGEVLFMAVHPTFRLGPEVTEESLAQALETCARMADEAGVAAATRMQSAEHAADALLPAATDHDLLVVGTHGGSRAAGIVSNSTASRAAHQTDGALLVARGGIAGKPAGEFPQRILLASDGESGSESPAGAAAAIAGAFGSHVSVVHVPDDTEETRRPAVESQLGAIEATTGERPELIEAAGSPAEAIIDTARDGAYSLLVTGRRGLKGLRALGSVSERVVHQAPCSVLLVPPGEGSG